MDGSRFDAWTRRKFGLAIGGGVASALGLGLLDAADAKKGNSKRCKRFQATCNPNGKKCCKGLDCEEGACCKKLGTKCTDGSECCGTGICDNVVPESTKTICCNLEGNFCKKDTNCCEGFTCDESQHKCVQVV